MTEFKKAVPTDRTIVDGIWSDILDEWSDTFVTIGDTTAQQVSVLDTVFLEGLSDQLHVLNNDNKTTNTLLRALVLGIEILVDFEPGGLVSLAEQDN